MAKVSPGAAMDADFLKRTVGEPLSEALTSLVVAQPADPIEFIGEALLDFIKRKEAGTKRDNHAKEVARLLSMSREQQDIADRERGVEEAAKQAKLGVEQEAEAAILKASCHAEVQQQVLNLVRERLGAAGAQIGRKVVLEGQEIVEFIAASEGREDMVGQELKGLREGEDPEDGAVEEGITFNLWKRTEQPPPPDPVYDEEGELVPDESEPELIPPEHLLVENVVREPRVKFFGIPKLGSYLAIRITYGSWLQPGGISDVPPPSEDEAPGDDEGQDEDNVAEEPAEGADGVGEKAPKAPPSVYSKVEAPVELALCVDTMGQGRCFTAEDIAWAKTWAAKLKTALEALESRMFDDEAALLPSFKSTEAAALVAKATEGEEEAVEKAVAALEPGTPEDDKDRVSKATRYRTRVKAVEAVGDLVGLMGKLNLAPPAGVLDVLERALLLVGKAKADLCDARGAVDWVGKMRNVVSKELVSSISAFKPEDAASAPLAAEAKEAVEAIDARSVQAVNVPALAILEWMSSAIVEVEDAAAAAEAAEAAAAAAAEAAAAAAAEAAEAAAEAAEAAAAAAEEEEGEEG